MDQKKKKKGIFTKRPHKLRDNKAQVNDLDKPNKMILDKVPIKPIRMTGRRPILSDNIPQWIPKIYIYD